jgi:O-antigen ligase
MNTNQTLRYSIITGLILLLATPFMVFDSFYFPFITSKAFFFRTIVAIVFLLWGILAVRDKEYRPKKNILLASFSLFVLMIFVSNIFGANFENSMFSRLERMEGFITIINLYALFLVASSVMTKRISWDILFNLSIIASIIMSVYGLFQLAGKIVINQGGVRLDGRLGNSIYLAVYTLFNIFITLLYLIKNIKRPLITSLYSIALVFQFITLYFTATRGATLGLIGGIILTLGLMTFFHRKLKIVRNTALSIIVIIILGIVLLFSFSQTAFVKESSVLPRFVNISLSEGTVVARFMVWDSAWQGFKERPILGWGQGNFSYPFSTYYKAEQYAQEPWFDRSHNAVFDWLINGGIIGLILYLSLFGSTLYLLWFKENDFSYTEKSVLTGLLAAYGFQNLTVFDNIVSYMYFILIMAYVSSRTNSKILFENLPRQMNYALIVLVVILIPWQLYAFNYQTYKQASGLLPASTIFVRDRSTGQVVFRLSGGPLQNLNLYKQIFERDAAGDREAIQSLSQISTNVIKNQNIPTEIRNEFVVFTSGKFSEFIKEDPDQAVYYDLSARFHGSIGILERSLADINKVIELSPQKQSAHIIKTQILFLLQRPEEALANAKFGYELYKENERAWRSYLDVAISVNNEELAQMLMDDYRDMGRGELVDEYLEAERANGETDE